MAFIGFVATNCCCFWRRRRVIGVIVKLLRFSTGYDAVDEDDDDEASPLGRPWPSRPRRRRYGVSCRGVLTTNALSETEAVGARSLRFFLCIALELGAPRGAAR